MYFSNVAGDALEVLNIRREHERVQFIIVQYYGYVLCIISRYTIV